MKKLLLGTAMAALLGAWGATAPASAKEYVFALVPKNMNNPFFDQARDGCKKAEAESGGKFTCDYIGPGEHGGGDDLHGRAAHPAHQQRHPQRQLDPGEDLPLGHALGAGGVLVDGGQWGSLSSSGRGGRRGQRLTWVVGSP